MKKILFAIGLLLSVSAFSQVDSSALQLPIRLSIKVKFWAIAGSNLQTKSPFSDTALLCVGSGNNIDSIASGTVRAGRFLRAFEIFANSNCGDNYTSLHELINSNAANGGLIAQLNNYIQNGTLSQKRISAWLKKEVISIMNQHAVSNQLQITNGILNLQGLTNSITDN